ncbi:hypothetical protein JHD50_12395 [Sulfurimonas sp. MAG313]|nr:hypothetical protein [Sulfurimonas sp. MAG313]MDF1882088.1 hypothetical protein [Sulfurimonas sp. MAG313]
MTFSGLFPFSTSSWNNDIVPFPTELTDIKAISIKHINSKQSAELKQLEIHDFLSFMEKGKCNKVLKGATRYHIRISHESGTADYYIHGDTLGPERGGLVQATFEPKKRGFEVFLHSFF